jgi:hypothetical protein
VRLAASCSEKAVTFHKQCGSDGWSGPHLFLGPFSPQICADQRGFHHKDAEEAIISPLILRFLFPYNKASKYVARRNNY